MNDVTDQFERERDRLRKVAHRMLGSQAEADDAVQEAWLHVARADTSSVENMSAWLTTVVARVCLDMLRSRKSRREELALDAPPASEERPAADPESAAVLADSVGVALMIVLDMLDPAERVAFVLHDLFGMSFDEIATVLGKSSDAARQLASRARRRVHGAPTETRAGERKIAEAFLTALRAGDMAGLLAVLDPDVVVTFGAQQTRGAQNWVKGAVQFGHMARAVSLALVDGAPGLIWAPHGKLQRALTFTFANGRVTRIEIIGDPTRIAKLDIGVP